MLYPTRPAQKRRTLALDALIAACLILLAIIAVRTHSGVAGLARIGGGVSSVGDAISSSFDHAADALGGIPLVGSAAKHALETAGATSGGTVTRAGHHAQAGADHAAVVISLLLFLVPALVLMQWYLPFRLNQIRQLRAVNTALDPDADQAYRRLVAQRATLTLPYDRLLKHSSDPFRDLAADHFEPLVRAAAEQAGLNPSVR